MTNIRSLYDKEYLDSGCTLEYNEIYNVDDTVWTYATNFAVTVVCVVAAAFIAFSSKPRSYPYIMPAFFIFDGLAFGIGGFYHALITTTENPARNPFIGIGLLCFVTSAIFLVMEFLLTITRCRSILLSVLIVSIVILVIMVAQLAQGIKITTALPSLYIIAAHLFMAIVSWIQTFGPCLENNEAMKNEPKYAIVKTVSGLVMVAGLLVQFLLAGTCGKNGYEACFKDCPLPNPGVFNHNALFHIIYMIGLAAFGWAEYKLPTNSEQLSSLLEQRRHDEEVQPEQGFMEDGI